MSKSSAIGIALLNLVVGAIVAGVATQFSWKEWWLPLLVVGAACSLASSGVLWILESRALPGSPERKTIQWIGTILFLIGGGIAAGVWRLSQ